MFNDKKEKKSNIDILIILFILVVILIAVYSYYTKENNPLNGKIEEICKDAITNSYINNASSSYFCNDKTNCFFKANQNELYRINCLSKEKEIITEEDYNSGEIVNNLLKNACDNIDYNGNYLDELQGDPKKDKLSDYKTSYTVCVDRICKIYTNDILDSEITCKTLPSNDNKIEQSKKQIINKLLTYACNSSNKKDNGYIEYNDYIDPSYKNDIMSDEAYKNLVQISCYQGICSAKTHITTTEITYKSCKE